MAAGGKGEPPAGTILPSGRTMASTWAGPPFMATVSAGRLWTDDASDEASSCSGWEDAAFSSSDAALEAGWLSGLLSASETAEDAEEAEEAGLLSAADWAGWPLPQAASCKTSAAARHPARIFFNLNSSFSFHYPVFSLLPGLFFLY